MIIDKALQTFKETYDREAIESIVQLSEDRSLYKSSFKGFNIQEAVNKFITYLNGYAEYRIENVDKTEVMDNNTITEHTKSFIKNKSNDNILFEEAVIPFNDSTKFIQEYFECIGLLIESVNKNQTILMESIDDSESSGCILKFTEMFLEDVNERIHPIMEYLLQSSGYYSRKRLRAPSVKKEQNFFL
jgi:hypothetical protein